MLPFLVISILRWVWAWDLETVSTVIFSIIIITEGYSIIWHIYSINSDWKQIPEIDAMSLLINFIANLIKWKMPKEIELKEIDETETEETKKEE